MIKLRFLLFKFIRLLVKLIRNYIQGFNLEHLRYPHPGIEVALKAQWNHRFPKLSEIFQKSRKAFCQRRPRILLQFFKDFLKISEKFPDM